MQIVCVVSFYSFIVIVMFGWFFLDIFYYNNPRFSWLLNIDYFDYIDTAAKLNIKIVDTNRLQCSTPGGMQTSLQSFRWAGCRMIEIKSSDPGR